MIKYYGKRYLYTFLKEHGYNVPHFRDMKYKHSRCNEYLESKPLTLDYGAAGIEVFVESRQRRAIRIWRYELSEDGRPYQVEWSNYYDGVLFDQKSYEGRR